MSEKKVPPFIGLQDNVMLFDGVCKLCHCWVNFIMANDPQQQIKFCAVQSKAGQAILEYYHFPTEQFDTMIWIKQHRAYTQSSAFFQVMNQLGYPYKLLFVLKVFPRAGRDWLYAKVASNRYSLFGKYAVCQLPSSDLQSRFIEGGDDHQGLAD